MRAPRLPTPFKVLWGDIHIYCIGFSVDVNDVTVLDQGDRTTDLSFWYNVSDHETMRPDGGNV
jgi:hypothetical protein